MREPTHYVPTYFRFAGDRTEDIVGRIQHLLIDKEWTIARVCRKFKISLATAYRIKAAVPAHLITIHRPKMKAVS